MLGLVGCGSSGDAPLVIATSWPASTRSEIEAVVRSDPGHRAPIVWVELAASERLASSLDRRGGVDLFLGSPLPADCPLLGERHPVHRPAVGSSPPDPRTGFGDPRDNPSSLAQAKAVLQADEWDKGYETLVRRASLSRPTFAPSAPGTGECVAVVRGGMNPDRAARFVLALESRGVAGPSQEADDDVARAEGLLADLLGAALVDSHEELRDAEAALRRFGHPAKAEAAIGERPPWPPASVLKLRADPSGASLLETLAEQIAPDPESRAWLLESWNRPKRGIDGALLAEIAGAVEGRLASEPRFRAWLRGEWTAWTRQRYRRVARVAGGYVPS